MTYPGLRALEDGVHDSQRNDDAKYNRDDGDPKRIRSKSESAPKVKRALVESDSGFATASSHISLRAQNGSRGHRNDGKQGTVQEGAKRCKSHPKSR